MTTEAAVPSETEEEVPATETTQEDAPGKDWQAEAEKWKSLSRQHEAQAKANAEAAKKIQEIEDATKSETERLQDKVARAEAQAKDLGAENARLRVALTKGLSAEQMEFLTGDTEEELSERADKLLALIKPDSEEEEPEEAVAGLSAPTAPRPKLKSGGASTYGIGNDDALLNDLKRKVGVR